MTVRWQPMTRRRRVPQWLKDGALILALGSWALAFCIAYGWLKARGWL